MLMWVIQLYDSPIIKISVDLYHTGADSMEKRTSLTPLLRLFPFESQSFFPAEIHPTYARHGLDMPVITSSFPVDSGFCLILFLKSDVDHTTR